MLKYFLFSLFIILTLNLQILGKTDSANFINCHKSGPPDT